MTAIMSRMALFTSNYAPLLFSPDYFRNNVFLNIQWMSVRCHWESPECWVLTDCAVCTNSWTNSLLLWKLKQIAYYYTCPKFRAVFPMNTEYRKNISCRSQGSLSFPLYSFYHVFTTYESWGCRWRACFQDFQWNGSLWKQEQYQWKK